MQHSEDSKLLFANFTIRRILKARTINVAPWLVSFFKDNQVVV